MWGDHLYTEGGIFFPVVEIDMPQEFAGSARAIGCPIGYLPSLRLQTLWLFSRYLPRDSRR
ncbi:Uncharacterized protein YP598_3866 [Yersinia pseudotuberculosis]|uniref:Uncharacterized protein n=1 Tax=Yersinia pseudotuberculosis serotype O:3 (strain YPIII) TaxID=502800 RepID=A0A0H3B736_YERPY|nr:hypothetical protein BLA52_07870 [Yersinia pseudotuberculosis]PSH25015.1 hypothetical protein BLA50_13865 [Yersinia pseudotuberculosis]PSH28598.1 hypothetical protein BLA51_17475 [Yersinia pseudotuberculosis]PSH33484.1 hypothetical protein BA197_15265 [Yersinia pseudotuberculosis]PSH41230.1 hypothetical protein BA193_17615 [Yersinia pseudotuberculosis]